MTKQELLKAIDSCPMDANIVIKESINLHHVASVEEHTEKTLYKYGEESKPAGYVEIRLIVKL